MMNIGARKRAARDVPPVVITGGAGFIGTNLASHFLSQGQPVILYDNLSRVGVVQNYHWLQVKYGDLVSLRLGDVRDLHALTETLRHASAVFHLAAQVAVTMSLDEPMYDFHVNTGGTLNVLNALRSMDRPPPLIFTSTNKVYGSLSNFPLQQQESRYSPPAGQRFGIDENRPLEFYSPYGCSKGAADQYVLDHARIYGLPAAVFRMSCIYGPHQFGTEDQGWVAHFIIKHRARQVLTIYGDGRQVRDVLWVDDLVAALVAARERIDSLKGQAFNIGGGPAQAISLRELLQKLSDISGSEPDVDFKDWRPGDQRYYVSNTAKFQRITGWKPAVDPDEGIQRLYQWFEQTERSSVHRRRALAEV